MHPDIVRPIPLGGDYVPFPNMEARNGMHARVEVPLLLRTLHVPCGGRVLEVGCGRGIALPVLAARLTPFELVGVDIDGMSLEVASWRLRRARITATLIEADVRDLPLETASVDLVVDFGTCYHVSGGVSGALAALREVARVLRPGGLFVHETPVAQHLAHPVRSFRRRLPWRAVPTLVRDRAAILWAARRKAADAGEADA